MIYLIGGTTHTGKTLLAQRLLEGKHIPYLSIDHLKMGLIRSGATDLTVYDDGELTAYLWPILREIIKTAIENGQNLTVEGCYIPHTWAEDFDAGYREQIRALWLIMTEEYIVEHFSDIKDHANAIEHRLDDSDLSLEKLVRENLHNLEQCKTHGCEYILIDRTYDIAIP